MTRRSRYLPALALLLAAGLATAQVAVPQLRARVTDLTGTLTAQQIASLEQKLAAFEQRKGSQVAVLIVPSTRPETIEQFGIRVAEAWKLGRKGVDDGALLLIAKDDRELRIEVGYGLEGALTDATTHRIIDEIITPSFREGDFYGGIDAGVTRMLSVIDGEPLPEPQRGQRLPTGLMSLLPVLVIVTITLGTLFKTFLGQLPGSLVTGGIVGLISWVVIGFVLAGVLAGVVAFVLALMSGAGPRGWTNAGRGGFGGLGGGFGGGGGDFGGGGFSGGGGGFGGGGSSGRW